MSTENSTSSTAASRRLSQVYVEIPIYTPSRTTPHVQTSRKENAPLAPYSGNAKAMPITKRKLSDTEVPIVAIHPNSSMPKKSKVTSDPAGLKERDNTAPEFPSGFFYCHQCAKKRDISVGIQCTYRDVSTHARCKAKYCRSCLKNRYGENTDDIKGGHSIPADNDKAGHIDGLGFFFKCPKCRDECNCARCRKAKGLEPTGNLVHLANRAGAVSVAALLVSNPKAEGIMPGKGQQIEPIKKPRAPKRTDASVGQAEGSKARKPKAVAKKILQPPAWPSLLTPLTLPSALARIQIREFCLRFADVLDLPKASLEELDLIAGANGRLYEHDDESEREECEWVSEVCIKGLVLGLLGPIAQDLEGEQAKAVRSAVKEISSNSPNLNKVWSALSSLRDAAPTLKFPDPLPAPSSANVHKTRTTRNTTSLVVQTAQLIPVMVALCDRVLDCESVRQELDTGMKEGREKTRQWREGIKKETERWESEKQTLAEPDSKEQGKAEPNDKKPADDELKHKRDQHKQELKSLEQSLRIAMSPCGQRFGPLGRDVDGRIYWALSPGVEEREAAEEYLAVHAGEKKGVRGKGRTAKGRRAAEEDERKGMRKWSWFVAVWGKRPDDADVRVVEKLQTEDDDEEEEEDDGEEKWWGFWQPEEICLLAAFVGRRGGLDNEDGKQRESASAKLGAEASSAGSSPLSEPSEAEHPRPTDNELRSLTKGLQEYADLLEWRIKRDEQPLQRGRVVDVESFYAQP